MCQQTIDQLLEYTQSPLFESITLEEEPFAKGWTARRVRTF
jgi:hypothetical protein